MAAEDCWPGWADRLDVRGEDPIGAQQRLDAHGRRDVGRPQQGPQVVQGQDQHAQHAVGAVDQGQSLLGRQGHLLQAGGGERLGGRDCSPVRGAHRSLADGGEGAGSQRGQVAGATERTVLVHHGGQPGIEEVGVACGDHRSHSGPAGGERLQPQQQQGAHHFGLDLRSDAGGVGPHERDLQPVAGPAVDTGPGQGSKAGRHAVDRPVERASASTA